MSIWTFRVARVVAGLCLATVLTGCFGQIEARLLSLTSKVPEAKSGNAKAQTSTKKPLNLFGNATAPKRLAVAGGAVTIAAPPGYCVDKRASRDRPQGAFVLMASCAGLSSDPGPEVPALLTATVGAPGTAALYSDPEGMERYFRSAAGRTALSRSGNGAEVRVVDITPGENALVLQISDRGTTGPDTLGRESWRAVFVQSDRLVFATVVTLKKAPLRVETARSLLNGFVARIREESITGSKTATADLPAAE